ncbi:MAG: M16 family metallopeptidase [Phycisphaerae bacterium]
MQTRGFLIAWTASLVGLVVCPELSTATPLPSNPQVLSGTLDNGMRWMYRRHQNPPGKMALALHVRTGSLNETQDQRGLAHFLEHLAFNGSEHFPPGELVAYFESIGMELGPDLNGFAGFVQTVYLLFTPRTRTEQVDKALMALSDYAFGLSLIEEEIEKERGVILAESSTEKNASQRIRDKLWPRLFEGSRFATRLPIGDEGIIKSAPRSEFVDYYRTWYRPENLTLIMVGDADPTPFKPLIEKWFGGRQPETPLRPHMGPEFRPFNKARAIVVTDPELALCDVEMINMCAGRPPVTTVEQWRIGLVETLGSWIAERRHQERVSNGEASYRGAHVFVYDFFHDALLSAVNATGEPGHWNQILEELVVEVNRARRYGFSERELAAAKKELLADARRAVRIESTRSAKSLLMELVFAVRDNRPVLSARQKLDLLNELLPSIKLAEVTEVFAQRFAPGTFAYVISSPERDDLVIPSADEVLAVARKAWLRSVDPLPQADRPSELLAVLPSPGKIAATSSDPDLEITSVWLDNGVRVHHRYLQYKHDSVWVSISLAGGRIEETAANAGATEAALLAVNEAATSTLTSNDMRDIMTGRNIHVSAENEHDSLTIYVTGAPRDLEAGLQQVYALLTDGRIEESAFNNWKLATLQEIEQKNRMPVFKGEAETFDLVTGSDPRLTFLTRERVNALSLVQVQAWFDRLRRDAPVEVAVVGDITLEQVMPMIARYVGSLPQRRRAADHLDELRRVARPAGPLSRVVKVDTVTPQALTVAGFMACDGKNADETRALQIASKIVSSRIIKRIREELSLVYSVRLTSEPSWVYRDMGWFGGGAPCDPANARRVADEMHHIYQEFADTGPTAEELENAKKQIANDLDEEMREPKYWLKILKHHDLHRRSLEEQKRMKSAYRQLTREHARTVFQKYYTPKRRVTVIATPDEHATPAERSRNDPSASGTM